MALLEDFSIEEIKNGVPDNLLIWALMVKYGYIPPYFGTRAFGWTGTDIKTFAEPEFDWLWYKQKKVWWHLIICLILIIADGIALFPIVAFIWLVGYLKEIKGAKKPFTIIWEKIREEEADRKKRKEQEEKEGKEKEQEEKRKEEEAEKRKKELIEKYGEKDGMMIFNGEISEDEYLRKKELIEKYGDKYGEAVFEGEILVGMPKGMVIEAIGEAQCIDGEKWYYGNPSTRKHLNRVITFKDEKLLSDEKLDKSIWLDMPKDMLVASWGDPADEKEDVSKDKVKLKWYFGARQTRQKTTAYKYEVRLENDLVVGWRELE